jgi:hypothetical protein
MNDLDGFERDKALLHEIVEQRNKRANLLLGVHDLDQDRQVRREIENARRMHDRMTAETLDAFKDGCSGKSLFARGFDDRGVKRLRTATIAFADEDAQQLSAAWELNEVLPRAACARSTAR